ncbi:3142_t:CDS:2 [Diversispora eburnea]|uniref:3142_t:CDS:1 n=1 Tax=Diversispora eburnea TaxID=1213867 RepID=A0A9N9F989_9GLOM|nr:3142_t:CDS:2 [Diversispora eburnea]
MTFAWKAAGMSYLKYTQICARAVRNSLKDDLRLIAQRRDEQGLKFAKWEAGKQGEFVCIALKFL